MTTVDQLQRTLDSANQMVALVGSADLDKPTPCTEWTVRALVEHMIGTNTLFRGALSPAPRPASGQATGLTESYAQSAQELLSGWRTPGSLDGTLKLPMGEVPAATAITINLADQLIHTWDLARALGRGYAMDQDLAESVLTTLKELVRPEFRGDGRGFAAEVPCPPTASAQDRLIAFSGRQP